ncbi:DNA-directed RNA polymerase I subunit rpa49 [Psilocybe cubensis]|uniref:Rpa49 subunit specific to nuclear RNA polymerase I n=2 Tax=Psilocybe cubensis TaxID=181762 RepID=A0A8H7XPP0_PSICU|nr:DNA-directed RNA polymerase I subunit rpa49 [Psilocybe cubensis]KAH9476998.1 DNA-directed RNA polymerase I subunit rpa49 [Psilocybe cubensis]
MSVAKAISKKRKRDSNPEAHFELSKPAPAKVGPILVSYPALQAPPATPFQCYSRKKSKRGGEDEEEFIVAGETDTVEFATNEDESRRASESGCRYLLAVHNTKTGTVSILPTPKTPHILSHTVKALKSIEPSAAPSKTAYLEAKTTLGETFGTKKQKAAIRANERNRIDVSAMEGVMGYVMDSIEKGAEGLMTAEESKEFADKNRLIPPFSMTAADPSDIYALHDIIPEAEWKALSITSLEAAGNYPERLAMLPYRRSQWVNHHLRVLTESTGKAQKKKLKILLYISAMLAFRQTTFQKTIDKEKLYERLSAVPGIVVDGLLSRFTEQARGSTSYHSTSATKTTLLTYTFALCLKVDDFASNTTVIAHDLSMTVTEVNQLFKSLGCKIVKLGDRERAKLGLSDSSADEKRAVLTAPVEFPKPRLRKKT